MSVSCRCNLVKNKQMSTNDRNLRIAADGSGDDGDDVGVSQRSEQSVSLATDIVGRPLPSPEQILCFAVVNSMVGDGVVDSVVRDFDTLRHRRKLRNEKRRRNSSNGLSASPLRTLLPLPLLPPPPQSELSDENIAFVGGTIKLFDLCLRFCFFDFVVDAAGDGGGEIDPVGDKLDTSVFCTEFLLDLRRKLMVFVRVFSFLSFVFFFFLNSRELNFHEMCRTLSLSICALPSRI